ncbi:MAG: S26 family signal peptidase [Synergistaceae bacterium]|jgi:conjugative transfer signal peptidase TraF|nr:S26 family signal peptidase [Synergistaceae bacterium]
MKKKYFVPCFLLSCLMATALFLRALHSLGYRVNLSESLPGHLYRAYPLKEGDVLEPGDNVLIDLSRFHNPIVELGIKRGYVSRSRKMLKEIGAVPGDLVALRDNLLYVNGRPTLMIVSPEDSLGGKLLPYPTPLILPQDCYWLVSVPDGGFDSRYFGPIDRSAFTHKAFRVF